MKKQELEIICNVVKKAFLYEGEIEISNDSWYKQVENEDLYLEIRTVIRGTSKNMCVLKIDYSKIGQKILVDFSKNPYLIMEAIATELQELKINKEASSYFVSFER